MTAARRFGLENSKTRSLLLDAAEQLMIEEGYAAVTSRRVAAKAGLKPQLVHYYFRTMDDLFLALLRRLAQQNFERLERAVVSDKPIRALWEINMDLQGSTLAIEFSALANHRKTIRAEIASYGEKLRSLQAEVLERVLSQHRIVPEEASPMIMSLLLTGISRTLVLETALGIRGGHEEMLAIVERYLKLVEEKPLPKVAGSSSRS